MMFAFSEQEKRAKSPFRQTIAQHGIAGQSRFD
jgi:hypothetical protein